MKKLFARQGDLLFFQVNEVKGELKSVENQILAEGEKSGHKHTLVKERPETQIEIAHDGIGFYLKVSKGNAIVTHEEHRTIKLMPGVYEVRRQTEYDPVQYRHNVQD